MKAERDTSGTVDELRARLTLEQQRSAQFLAQYEHARNVAIALYDELTDGLLAAEHHKRASDVARAWAAGDGRGAR